MARTDRMNSIHLVGIGDLHPDSPVCSIHLVGIGDLHPGSPVCSIHQGDLVVLHPGSLANRIHLVVVDPRREDTLSNRLLRRFGRHSHHLVRCMFQLAVVVISGILPKFHYFGSFGIRSGKSQVALLYTFGTKIGWCSIDN